MNRRQRRHEMQDPWDDFSFGGFLAGWRNPHRRWRGHSIFWASGLAMLFLVVVIAVMGLVSLLVR